MIGRIGIKVNIRATTGAALSARVLKKEHQFTFNVWGADYPDSENFLFLLYGPNSVPGPNNALYASPEYDRLFEQMRSLPDTPGRRALIEKMRAVSVEDCPWIPLYHSANMSLSYDWLKNVKAHPISADYLMYRRVDGAERARRQKEWNAPNYAPLYMLAVLLAAGSIPAIFVVRARIHRKVRHGSEDIPI